MRRRYVFAVLALFAAAGGQGALAQLIAEPSPGGGAYDFDWSACTLQDALRELYERFEVPSIAVLLPKEKPVNVTIWPQRTTPRLLPRRIAGSIGRDCVYVGKVNVLRPCSTEALVWVLGYTARQLTASLTDAQLRIHQEQDGIPFSSLTAEQQNTVRYLIRASQKPESALPEAQLESLLENAKLTLAIHAKMSWDYKNMSSGFPCDSKASQELLKRWSSGQVKAVDSAEKAQTEPGPDVPGGADVCELSGVYKLGDLIAMIARSSGSAVSCEAGARDTRVAAYCRITAAGLARACAIAASMEWRTDGEKWELVSGTVSESLAHYSPEKSSAYVGGQQAFKSRLREIMNSGRVYLVADSVWRDEQTFKRMMNMDTVKLDELTREQRDYLMRAHESHSRAYLEVNGPLADIEELDIWWDPAMRIYVSSGDWILYSEWLNTSEHPRPGSRTAEPGK